MEKEDIKGEAAVTLCAHGAVSQPNTGPGKQPGGRLWALSGDASGGGSGFQTMAFFKGMNYFWLLEKVGGQSEYMLEKKIVEVR